jgi:hypothetical protein
MASADESESHVAPSTTGSPDARSSADPVDLGAQSDLIGAPEPMSVEAVLAVPNGGSGAPRAPNTGRGSRP